jgi:hypothetical protein
MGKITAELLLSIDEVVFLIADSEVVDEEEN